MSRISIYVPQLSVPALPVPEIVPIDGTRGLFAALETVLQTADAHNRQPGSPAPSPQAAGSQPTDQTAGEPQPSSSTKDGVAGAGESETGAVDPITAKQKQDASAYAANALAKLSEAGLDAARIGTQAGIGHTLEVNDAFEKHVSEIFANAPNDFATQMLVRQVPRVHLEVQKAAIAAEAGANVARRYTSAMDTLDIFGRLITADPSNAYERIREARMLGASLVMSPKERAVFEGKLRELPLLALSATIDRDPKRALTEMKLGRWSDHVDASTLNSMKAIAEQQITLGEAHADAESEFNKAHLRLDLDKFGKTLVEGQTTSGTDPLNNPERFTDILGKNVAKAAANLGGEQREIGTFVALALSGTGADLQKMEKDIHAQFPLTDGTNPENLRELLLTQYQPEDLRRLARNAELLSPAMVQASSTRVAPGSPMFASGGHWNWDPEATRKQSDGWDDVTPTEPPVPGTDGPEIWRNRDLDPPFPPYPVVPNPAYGVQPDRWRRHPAPHTPGGHILISPDELPERQQRNLREREWVSPTGQVPDYGPTQLGDSYFGSYRSPHNAPKDWYFHGGLDFKGSKVVLPTRARFKSLKYSPDYGYMISFDLGDGMTLSLLHVQPTAELLALAKSGDHPIWDARHELGVVDPTVYNGKGDHVHVQITMENGRYNGQPAGFAIDPTPMFPNQYSAPQRAPASNGWQQFWDWLKTLGR